MSNLPQQHWDNIYKSKEESEVSWFQQYPNTSVEFIKLFELPRTAAIIDRGIKCIEEDHVTPFNTVQNFLFCSFQKK